MWFLCKEIYKTTPDDKRITEMDPVQKIWMFQNWLADQNDNAELAKNHAYLIGSFTNPEAVKQLMGDNNVFESTDEDFEESTKMVRDASLLLQAPSPIDNRKRHRRTLKE